MSTSEKYISEALMKDKPKIPIGLFLRDKSVTTRKLVDKAVTEEKLADGAVTSDKLGDDVLKQLNDTVQHLNNTDQRLNNVSTKLDDNITNTNNNSDILKDVVKHVYPRILMNEDDLNALIEKGGPFEEGMDYLAYEDNG